VYQKIILVGRLGADPVMRYTQDGTAVTNFSVATDQKWTSKDGSTNKKTVWFRVSAWRRLAETCNQYLSKGRQVFVEGTIQEPRVYQTNNGEWRASLDVRAYKVVFLGSSEERAQERATAPEPETQEEIPF